ncbi:MAG TPA: sugar ABC transporter permease [Herpetosiphon sp.]|uniref:Xylose transport system permease protein XylH n=1 Tax=Herpetosiphon aurantiacus (strain ATCC 23779 / DSM 785 / 114-95) TaxID=316274 RepID=A9B686_HERA2|nr:multiple monosaccharide ABC transporter permease [Herpetosiphon sp.]ABX06297.1 Monosaccharide-transporting ATPase [Herpetosiphon aurantiacus DSM 785]HBW48877.1 sugar ABC transporter permease [Herpetosiphon sp.]
MSAELKTNESSKAAGFNFATVVDFFKNNMREYGMLVALVIIVLYFQFQTDGVLLQPLNVTNVILQNSYIVVMALGMLLIIVAGHIDLSVGSVAAFVGAVAGYMLVEKDYPIIVAFAACIAIGAAIGAFQGYWVAFRKIPAFIVTLAGMLIFRGLTLVMLGGTSLGPFPSSFREMSTGFIGDPIGGAESALHITTLIVGLAFAAIIVYLDLVGRKNSRSFNFPVMSTPLFIAKNALIVGIILAFCYILASYEGLPNVLLVLIGLIALYMFVTKKTVIGRRIYALGGNEKAAKLSGVPTDRLTFYTFINMGVLAAIGGLIFTARLNSATPKAGTGFELDVIASVFIGGASASGGIGTVFGVVIGALVMGVLNNGMSIAGVSVDWQQVIKGAVLLVAVYFDVSSKNKG